MLSGEPGIGKSRPAEELAQRAEKNGAQVLWGRCSEDRGAPAYWPWVQIIRSCIENLETSELRSSLGPDSALIAQIVPELSNLIDQPNDGNHIPEATEAQFRLYDTVLRFLSALSGKKPIVIVLEDLHWADIASLKLLVHFVQGMAQSHIFVVGTYRDVEITRNHPLFQTLGDLTRLRIFSRMQLHGLDPDSVGKIIETHEGVVPPSDLVAAIHSQTEGNPLFVGEMSRFLVQERLIRGELKSNELFDGVGLPEGIREVIGRRLRHAVRVPVPDPSTPMTEFIPMEIGARESRLANPLALSLPLFPIVQSEIWNREEAVDCAFFGAYFGTHLGNVGSFINSHSCHTV
jgi:predicted ATPase